MLFTSERGKKFGYEDGWNGDLFYYCGEGQDGDMEFVRGNKAIRDHQVDGYSLHLFKSVPGKKGVVEYIGQFVCVGYEVKKGIDRDKRERKGQNAGCGRRRNGCIYLSGKNSMFGDRTVRL